MLTASVDAIDAALPQTQCTRCGYPDCRAYAQAIADGNADINRCPPGGAEGVARLAALTGRTALPLDADCGREGPLRLALIDEAWCIGCTLCITACPVDCIAMVAVDARADAPTGWAAWSLPQAADAQRRYRATTARREQAQAEAESRLASEAARRVPTARP